MAVDHNTRLVRQFNGKDAPSQTPDVEIRQGQVVSVQSDGTATITVGGDPEPIDGVHSDSNYVPKAGDTVWVEVADTEMTILRKNGTSPTVFRGFVASPFVATSETRAATTYGALATAGPSVDVTVGESGILLVHIACLIGETSDNDGGAVSFTLSGANTLAADDSRRISFIGNVVNAGAEFGKIIPVSGLSPGVTTVTMVYKDLLDTGNDVTYANRQLWAMPL